MIRALALVLALLIAPASAISAAPTDIDRKTLGPILVELNDQNVWTGCLRWRNEILAFMKEALKNVGFETAAKTPNADHAILKIIVSARYDPETETCQGHFNAHLVRAVSTGNGFDVKPPLLIHAGDALGPARKINKDLLKGLKQLVNYLKVTIAE